MTRPGGRPSSLRLDQLDRYDRQPIDPNSEGIFLPEDRRYPMIIHFGVRPASHSYAGDER